MARKRIATPAEGMPPKRDAHRGAHPETAESCLGTGEMENRQTVQIGEISGGGRAEAKSRTATAGADPEPAKSLVNAAKLRERDEMLDALVRIGNWCAQDLAENTYISDSSGNYLKTLNGLCEVCKPYMQKASKLKRYGGAR